MGFPSTRAGGGVPVEVLRRLGHYLILEASGHLAPPKEEAPAKAADPTPLPKSLARKRGLSEVEHTQEVVVRYEKGNCGLGWQGRDNSVVGGRENQLSSVRFGWTLLLH